MVITKASGRPGTRPIRPKSTPRDHQKKHTACRTLEIATKFAKLSLNVLNACIEARTSECPGRLPAHYRAVEAGRNAFVSSSRRLQKARAMTSEFARTGRRTYRHKGGHDRHARHLRLTA